MLITTKNHHLQRLSWKSDDGSSSSVVVETPTAIDSLTSLSATRLCSVIPNYRTSFLICHITLICLRKHTHCLNKYNLISPCVLKIWIQWNIEQLKLKRSWIERKIKDGILKMAIKILMSYFFNTAHYALPCAPWA